jgi:hypothetical protein
MEPQLQNLQVLKKRLPIFRWICKQLQSKTEATPMILKMQDKREVDY